MVAVHQRSICRDTVRRNSHGWRSAYNDYITSPVIDLSSYAGKRIGVTLKAKAPDLWTQFENRPELVANLRIAVTTGAGWHSLIGRVDESRDWCNIYFDFEPWTWDTLGDPSQIRFRVDLLRLRDEAIELYIDNFSLDLDPIRRGPSNNFVFYSGATPAAAVIAGAAELIKATRPGATAAQLTMQKFDT